MEILSSAGIGKSSGDEKMIYSNANGAVPLPWLYCNRKSIFYFTHKKNYMILGIWNVARPPSCLGSLFVEKNNQVFPVDSK